MKNKNIESIKETTELCNKIINSDIIITLDSKNNRLFNTCVYLNNGKNINQIGPVNELKS